MGEEKAPVNAGTANRDLTVLKSGWQKLYPIKAKYFTNYTRLWLLQLQTIHTKTLYNIRVKPLFTGHGIMPSKSGFTVVLIFS